MVVNAPSLELLGPAFLVGLLVVAANVPLGAIVLNRGIVLLGIAVAQVAALGASFGNVMWGSMGAWAVEGSAIVAALASAMLLSWTEERFQPLREAIIGAVYIVALAMQIVLLSSGSGGLEHLRDLLVGRILVVAPGQLILMGAVCAGALAVWYFRDLARERVLFYGVFAIVVSVSVETVGMLLVFASLIIPAVATRQAPGRWRLAMAFNLGAGGYLVGLVASAVLNLPTSPAIVGSLAVVGIVAAKLIAAKPKAEIIKLPRVKSLQDEIQVRLTKTKVA